ncbi:hypothetical protein P153DRAFT_412104 [Dothidotthia symphoricarpi CBS 119687]|uniref:Uncharacterized protein n=1 Tax=Dothidotthia symphoricarpi CBS 119687 TaxID=1392245 RepID=A0A6A5ZZV0_9PLEO|nr:uncharacterized protein P153DRAFT_412104 [Dothidotthia symphoricarpi CBS 119687]KAF2123861.1 hypothetical protein P153DRAFT_412104 [Dothidotthia symphoricarpi CBS 119687]
MNETIRQSLMTMFHWGATCPKSRRVELFISEELNKIQVAVMQNFRNQHQEGITKPLPVYFDDIVCWYLRGMFLLGSSIPECAFLDQRVAASLEGVLTAVLWVARSRSAEKLTTADIYGDLFVEDDAESGKKLSGFSVPDVSDILCFAKAVMEVLVELSCSMLLFIGRLCIVSIPVLILSRWLV